MTQSTNGTNGNDYGVTIGVDLGTTNSVASILEGAEPQVIVNAEGHRTTPSVVAFTKKGEVLVGAQAKRQSVTNPDRTVRSVKRHMGTDWTLKIDGTAYTPQEIAARILSKLKTDAEAYLGTPVESAVITVPAYFNDAQRQATREAGEIAGLRVARIVNEPTAAALSYGLGDDADEKIVVFDLGGGTYDVSVLELGDGVFEVLSTAGDTHLGGDDWDAAIVDWLVKGFSDENGIDLTTDPMAMTRLQEAAEKAKVELSSVQSTDINLPFITANASGPIHLQRTLSRSEFERMTADLLDRTREPFHTALKDAGLSTKDVKRVILVGGSTRMPAVVDLVTELAGTDPHRGVNPDEAVSEGAAVQAGVLTGGVSGVVLLDVTPLTLGIETEGGLATVMIPKNTTIPTSKTEMFTTASDNQPEVEVHVTQGERPMAADNTSLGRFKLTGIAPAPRGVPQIEVSFDIDANGIVSVKATDKATGRNQQVTITGGTSLTQAQIDKMIAAAEAHAASDAARKERVTAHNDTSHALWQMRSQLETLMTQGVVDDAVRAEIVSKMDELDRMLENDETPAADLIAARDDLASRLMSLGESVYANVQSASASTDDVVEAEIVEE